MGIIDEILRSDKAAPKKQRHTAKRIWERLREEHGFDGGYTIVKDAVRARRKQNREVFMPLSHPPEKRRLISVSPGSSAAARWLKLRCL